MGNVRMRAEQINYGATNVKVALDDLDPAALIELNNRMNRVDAWKATVKTEEKTGAEVTFTNALALAAVSLSAEIEAVQDLHGYDKPWVGGAGKNKYKMTTQTQTQDTVTVTANDDGTVNISRTGAATQNIVISLLDNQSEIAALIAAGGTYTLTSNKGAYDINTFNVTISYKNSASATTSNFMKIGDTVTFPVGAVLNTSNLYVGSGKTVNAYDHFALQLESGSTPTSYAPYENICPISGRTETSVVTEGKNLTYNVLHNVNINSSATLENNNSYNICLARIIKGMDYIVTTDDASGFVGGFYYDEPTIGSVAFDNTRHVVANKKFTAPITGYVAYRTTASYTTPQCEHGTVATAYVPYVGRNNVTIQLGQTVYGGSVDFTTGVMTVTHANIASYNGETINEPWISSLDEYTQGGTPTTGAQVVYTLAAPTTIQLTPEQLTMLKGYNRISADTGDITVEAYTGAAWGGDES